MSRELPFPIAFELPPGWSLVSPDASGRPEAAYVAVRDTDPGQQVATNIVVTGLGLHDVAVDVAALADAQLAALQATYAVTVLRRDLLSDGPARQAAQLLEIAYPVAGTTTTLRQIRIVSAFAGQDPADVAVVELVMTCPAGLFAQAGPEFAKFTASITPVSNAAAAGHRPGVENDLSRPADAAAPADITTVDGQQHRDAAEGGHRVG